MGPGAACTEIGDVMRGSASVDRQPEDITLFDMTGLALQDLTVARLVQEQAGAAGLGLPVAWPW